jgi:hypothetical protein
MTILAASGMEASTQIRVTDHDPTVDPVYPMFLPGQKVVLLDGMVKKRDDIPAAVLRRIRLLQSEVLVAKPQGGR